MPGVVTEGSDALRGSGSGDQVGLSPGWRGMPRVIGQASGLWVMDDCGQSLSSVFRCPLLSVGASDSASVCQDINLKVELSKSAVTALTDGRSQLSRTVSILLTSTLQPSMLLVEQGGRHLCAINTSTKQLRSLPDLSVDR